MKSHLVSRTWTVVLAAAPLLLVSACASTHPASAGASSPSSPSSRVTQPSSQSNAPATSGTISISDEIRRACGIGDEDAYFSFDSSAILSTDIAPLDAVARCFSVGPLKGRSLRLIGHADPRGTSEYNMTLGQGRADTVEQYLDRRGVRQSQVGATSRGAMDATGNDETGWAHDRRVDVTLGS
jgi:peptidoglycan-associated lipoprotein